MPLFGARPPVEDRERLWIEKMLAWCLERFGREALDAEILTPTPRFFPGRYQGTPDDVVALVDLVRAHLRVDPGEIAVALYDSGQRPKVAGHYSVRDGLGVIAIGMEDAPDPRHVVAVAAHELCHHKLLYRGIASSTEEDHEPLTDLATVFFGLGVFTANAAFTFSQNARGWRRRQLGYINQPMFGYALAYTARLRGERQPEWVRHLDTNPKGYFKKAMRYLEQKEPAL
ncbi:hypothetical protein [Catenulispora subtropica]|uniref:Peptidase M48 domain-containing protein n=1 Tax=Catenulispora subtropica TaxID=450798 RepID=A0ABN2RZD0_9ACTN